MTNPSGSRLNRTSKARQRYDERQRRRESMVVRRPDEPKTNLASVGDHENAFAPSLKAPPASNTWQSLSLGLRDALWYLRHDTPAPKIALGIVAVVLVLMVLSVVFSPQIGPNVWVMNVPVSGLTVEEAQTKLVNVWENDYRIDLVVDGQIIQQVPPRLLGLSIDAQTMAQNARNVGLSGFPLGYGIEPLVSLDSVTLQTLLIELVDDVYQAPYEAGYEWRDEQLVAVAGRNSRELDVLMTVGRLESDPVGVTRTRRLELVTKSTPPTIKDSTPYLDKALAFLNGGFTLVGYDPFVDERLPWTSTREEMTRWLAAGSAGLTLREASFRPFIEALNRKLGESEKPRYLDEREVYEAVTTAIVNNERQALLRIRYLPFTFTIESGDWGQRISRRTGLPFGLIDRANPGVNWNQLSVGQTINLPSRDVLLPEPVVPNKRIVVDLDRRYMVAYENGQVVMNWRTSIGREDAPTYPGIFQILSKSDVAYGSGFSLCSDNGCSQWEMYWFMGIYEVIPGLMNGFHGAVLLPNGAYLDDGQIGNASTFGCVMASNEQARQLYDWADMGTVVEIISREFPPQSPLGQQAVEFMNNLGV